MSSIAYPDGTSLNLYIDGEFLGAQGRETVELRDPGTGQITGTLPLATKDDLDRALFVADRAFKSWRHSSPMERSRILRTVGSFSRMRNH